MPALRSTVLPLSPSSVNQDERLDAVVVDVVPMQRRDRAREPRVDHPRCRQGRRDRDGEGDEPTDAGDEPGAEVHERVRSDQRPHARLVVGEAGVRGVLGGERAAAFQRAMAAEAVPQEAFDQAVRVARCGPRGVASGVVMGLGSPSPTRVIAIAPPDSNGRRSRARAQWQSLAGAGPDSGISALRGSL
jgi:hypothetical protein